MASTMSYYGCEDHLGQQHQTHFLEACTMCQKHLGLNRDIFMYRGNTAFCSDECRQEQIEMDEAEERSWRRRANRKSANAASKKSPAETNPPAALLKVT